MLTLSGHVDFFDLCCDECYFGCLQFVSFHIYVSVRVVCFMFDWVDELFVE